jgi:hypothetical protein
LHLEKPFDMQIFGSDEKLDIHQRITQAESGTR